VDATTLLMEPGPTQVDPRVIQTLCSPIVHHQSPAFITTVDAVAELLQRIYLTTGEVVVLPCSGRGAVEAVLTSVREPGGVFVVPTNGTFGRMMVAIGRSVGLKVVELPHESGEVIDRDVVLAELARHQAPILGIVHNETATGMVNDLSGYGAAVHAQGGLFLVDAVSSLAGTPIEVDGLDVDFCASASQKSVGALPGVAFVSVGERGRERLASRSAQPRGNYLDLQRWWDQWLPAERGGLLKSGYRRLPWSMPTHLVIALHRACELMFEEGLSARWDRHARTGAALRAALGELGLALVAPPGAESATVTAFYGNDVIGAADLRTALGRDHGITVAGGMDVLGGKIIRVGHMAETARPGPQLQTLSAIVHEMARRGYSAKRSPIERYLEVWSQAD
jgi:alanine-glyoxylate transaminase/serine-glyoxylate transaminase/serine-pyruvate transaminase